MSGRRVLIIGGSHDDAAGARVRAVELGAAAAVNLSGKVTDVVVLPGGRADRRMERVTTLGLPVHEQSWLLGPTADPKPIALPQEDAFVLSRGAVIDLPVTEDASVWTVTASWAQQTDCEVDVVAFVVDGNEQVSCDEDFVFYGAPEAPGGIVALSTDGPCDQAISVDLTAVPGRATRIVICAAIDGQADFGDVGAIEINAQQDSNGSYAQATLDAATSERTVLLAEIYRRGSSWRLRAIGQGHDYGLDELARSYGVDITDE